MRTLKLQHDASTPLVTQIIEGVRRLVAARHLKPGGKLPSIRAFAALHAVSVFTVVEAYDRLVAQGVLVSRGTAGFFVNRSIDIAQGPEPADAGKPVFDADWYLMQIFEAREDALQAGCSWLPEDWMFAEGVRRGLRRMANSGLALSGYGEPLGLPALRQTIATTLAQDQLIHARPHQIMLTNGSSHGVDLGARLLVRRGDKVLVDDPGDPNLMNMLRAMGACLQGVPRTPDGYDLQVLEELLAQEWPAKVFFTQPRLQNPTCSRASVAHMHRILQLAEQYQLTLVENDIYADMDASHQPSLASLDQLRNVIYLGSFSETIATNLRVGYLLAHPDTLRRLLQIKMLSGLTTSEVSEQMVYNIVTDGRWRKHLRQVRERLAVAQQEVAAQLQRLGFELFCEQGEGFYLWARHERIADAGEAVNAAAEEGIFLGPGQLFSVNAQPDGWLRFNVAFSQEPRLWQWLEGWLDGGDKGAGGNGAQ